MVSTGCLSCLRKTHCLQPRRTPPEVSPLCQARTHCSLGTRSAPLPASLPWAPAALPGFLAHFQGPNPRGLFCLPTQSLSSQPPSWGRQRKPTPLLAGAVLIITAPETREAPSRIRSTRSGAPALPTCCSTRLPGPLPAQHAPGLSQQTFLCSSSPGLYHPACLGLHALPNLRLLSGQAAELPVRGPRVSSCRLPERTLFSLTLDLRELGSEGQP